MARFDPGRGARRRPEDRRRRLHPGPGRPPFVRNLAPESGSVVATRGPAIELHGRRAASRARHGEAVSAVRHGALAATDLSFDVTILVGDLIASLELLVAHGRVTIRMSCRQARTSPVDDSETSDAGYGRRRTLNLPYRRAAQDRRCKRSTDRRRAPDVPNVPDTELPRYDTGVSQSSSAVIPPSCQVHVIFW